MSQNIANYLNTQLETLDARDILIFAAQKFAGKIQFASSMGAEDQVVTHLLADIHASGYTIPVFTLDTGRMFAETYELIQKTEARYKLKIRVLFPDATQVENMVNEKGINLFYESVENRKQCCGVRKIQPLKKALAGLDAWVTGLRREQSPTREDLQVVQWDEANQLFKINPLLNWTENQMWTFIKSANIPYNPLHDKGFPSIGCQPCTRAVLPGQDIRSGRWWWEKPETKECGLHIKQSK